MHSPTRIHEDHEANQFRFPSFKVLRDFVSRMVDPLFRAFSFIPEPVIYVPEGGTTDVYRPRAFGRMPERASGGRGAVC